MHITASVKASVSGVSSGAYPSWVFHNTLSSGLKKPLKRYISPLLETCKAYFAVSAEFYYSES